VGRPTELARRFVQADPEIDLGALFQSGRGWRGGLRGARDRGRRRRRPRGPAPGVERGGRGRRLIPAALAVELGEAGSTR
jgi:hypothetical protein